MRWIITGEWSGPSNPAGDYTRCVHVEVTDRKRFASQVEILGSIRYTDGTMLYLSVREMKKGERSPKPKLGYSKLIRDCIHHGVNSVEKLVTIEKALQVAERFNATTGVTTS